jgi:hypothetical protein
MISNLRNQRIGKLFSLFFIGGLIGSTATQSFAAPPALSYLYPAGAQRGTTVEIAAGGTFDPWPPKLGVSGTGVSVIAGKDKGKLTVAIASDAGPGVYWLRAYNAEGASGVRPFIVGMLPEILEKEPNDDWKNPQVLDRSSVVVNGRLDKAGDVDCFALSLKKGQTLVASCESNQTLKSPMDGVLQILSSDGFILEENNDFHGLDPQIAFTVPKDGTYIVRLFAFPAMPDASIRFSGGETYVYRLMLTTSWFADFAVPLAIERKKGTQRVELMGWNALSEGRELPIDAMKSSEPFLTLFDPKLANTVRLRVEPHPTFGVSKALSKEGKPFTPPFSLTGQIERAGGDARISFLGKKGQTLSVQVESRTFGLAINPVVRVLDSEKKQLARGEPGNLHADTTLAFTPTADGTYTIAVSDLYSGGGPRHAFLLRVLPSEPDYDLTVTTDRFTVTPGKPTTIPVKITRKSGFTKPVEVEAERLPEGVKLETTTPAKPDPGTITLSLTAEKPVSGSFRLIGKVKDEPKLTRGVRAPLTEFEDTTFDLWLTVASMALPPKK